MLRRDRHSSTNKVFCFIRDVSPFDAIKVKDCHFVCFDDVLDVISSERFIAREESEDCHTELSEEMERGRDHREVWEGGGEVGRNGAMRRRGRGGRGGEILQRTCRH
jgi:hypothetical protein